MFIRKYLLGGHLSSKQKCSLMPAAHFRKILFLVERNVCSYLGDTTRLLLILYSVVADTKTNELLTLNKITLK